MDKRIDYAFRRRWPWMYRDLEKLAPMTTEQVKALWDRYDGINDPDGISGEAIHMDLNLRGEGEYCAI